MNGVTPILPLTGLRAVAALWVVAHHLRIPIMKLAPDSILLERVLALGYLGVDLFAFLSGFVISLNYGERLRMPSRGPILRFLWLRMARIFPLHLFTLALLVLALVLLPGFDRLPLAAGRYETRDLLLNVLMVHGWGFADGLSWNAPSWTVSSEWFCYLAFPLLALGLARLEDGRAALAGAALMLLATLTGLRALGYPGLEATTSFGLLRIGGEFATGCLLQRAYSAGTFRELPWAAISLVALALATLAIAFELPATLVSLFAVLTFALAHDRGPLAWLLRRPAAVFWGEASYSIYLVHWVVLQLLFYFFPRAFPKADLPAERAVTLALYLSAILASAAITYMLVERPSRRWLRERSFPAATFRE